MVTHKSVNFTFSTYLHFMAIYLLALLYTSSNLEDCPFLKATNIAHIASTFVRTVRVKIPLFAPLELWWPGLGFGQDRHSWSSQKRVSLNWDVAMAVHPHCSYLCREACFLPLQLCRSWPKHSPGHHNSNGANNGLLTITDLTNMEAMWAILDALRKGEMVVVCTRESTSI